MTQVVWRSFWALLLILVAGCGKSPVEQALDSDANGYSCRKCKAKFYTARSVFATQCPECKELAPDSLLKFVCPVDQQVSLAPRSKGTIPCAKCGKPLTPHSIPGEADFKASGIAKRTAAEVGG